MHVIFEPPLMQKLPISSQLRSIIVQPASDRLPDLPRARRLGESAPALYVINEVLADASRPGSTCNLNGEPGSGVCSLCRLT